MPFTRDNQTATVKSIAHRPTIAKTVSGLIGIYQMKRTPVSTALGIAYPVLQAGLPWVSNPELVAAVSNAGGLGILHPTAGVEEGSEPIADLHAVIRRVQRLTRRRSIHRPTNTNNE